MRNETKRNGIIIGALLITIALMTIGYAALATQLTINGTASTGDAKWKIDFASITKNAELSTADAVEAAPASASGTSATFNVKLPNPGSKIVYDLVVQNTGTIDAEFVDVTGIDEVNGAQPTELVYSIDRLDGENGGSAGLAKADLPKTSGKHYFRVTVEWPAGSETVPTETTSKTGTIVLNYQQKVA